MTRSFTAASLLACAVLAGCASDIPTTPTGGAMARVASRSNSVAVGKHLVYFNGTMPSDLAGQVAALGGSLDATLEQVGVAIVGGLSDAAATELGARVGAAEVNPDVQYQAELPAPAVAADAAAVEIASPSAPNTAFFFPRQWNMRQIRAHHAWAAGHLGSPSVKVAILDTGIDYTHPDLVGLVDLGLSKSFVPSDDAFLAVNFPGAHPVADMHYHGTHVAATVASNALATAGVTSKTTLIGVKVLSRFGSGTTSGTLAAIVYAVDAGAQVINMSLGIRTPLPDQLYHAFGKAMNSAVQYAQKKGVAMIIAAGNEAYDVDTKHMLKVYCEAKHVTCVSATGPTAQASVNGPWTNPDALAGYSNYGEKSISVAAPGGNASAVWAACSRFTTVSGLLICRTGTFVVGLAGTSMATPHVTGTAALILAQRGPLTPGALREQLELHGVDDLGPKGKDAAYGRGRINVVKALGL